MITSWRIVKAKHAPNAFDGQGAVAGLTHATREVVKVGSVPVLTLDEGRERCAKVFGQSVRPTGVHAVSYLAVTAFVALLVFDKLGVGILRRAWFNLDLIWAAALVGSGAATLMM